MRKGKLGITGVLCLMLLVSGPILTGQEREINKTFDKKGEIRLKLVLGDCRIEKSPDQRIHVHLVYDYNNVEYYEPKFEEKSRSIYLREKIRGKNTKGYSKWTLSVPEDIEIDFEAATGDLSIIGIFAEVDGSTGTGDIEISGSRGEFDISTGTGRVEVMNSEGEFKVSSGTGRVTIENSQGNFDASSGTGDVEAQGLTIEFDGEFSSGTGDVEVSFPGGDDFELSLSSGTDDAVLDMQGKSIEGYFVFTCHARKGRIVSPVKFDEEEEFFEGDEKYLRKSIGKAQDSPRVYIKTGHGKAVLKK